MRAPSLALSLATSALFALAGCPNDPDFIECRDNTSCDRFEGGRCLVNPTTDHQFCAYPAGECASGMRWSDRDVEEPISGACVDEVVPLPDAGVDAPPNDAMPDAEPDGGGATCTPRIIYADGMQPSAEIYVINANGTGRVNLSTNAANDTWPTGGSLGRVAFGSARSGGGDIYAVDLDGNNLVNLTNVPATENIPVMSSDGTQIAFLRGSGVYVMEATGANAHAVATGTAYKISWNPQGTRIAFELASGGNTDIWTVDAGGSNLTQITTDAAYDGSASWSPDGTKIAFISQRGGQSDVYVMDSNGANPINVTNDVADNGSPSWSPDGQTLAFSSDADIYVMPATGGLKTPLATSANSEFIAKWSPTGEQILFRIDVAGYRYIGVVAATGGDVAMIGGPSQYSDAASWVACPL